MLQNKLYRYHTILLCNEYIKILHCIRCDTLICVAVSQVDPNFIQPYHICPLAIFSYLIIVGILMSIYGIFSFKYSVYRNLLQNLLPNWYFSHSSAIAKPWQPAVSTWLY